MQIYPYDTFATSLNKSLENKGGWDGPNDLSLGGAPKVSWHLSKDGLEYHEDNDRDIVQTVFYVAFLCGIHNGKAERQNEIDDLEHRIESLTRLNDIYRSMLPPASPTIREETKKRVSDMWNNAISKENNDGE